MENKRISIIIPIFNGALTIQRCVNSILAQDYPNVEIILVNDGSQDDTLNVCRRLKLRYSNIKLLSQKNMGVSIARNNGIRYATGDYVCFADSDDEYLDGAFQAAIDLCKDDSPDMIIGRVQLANDSSLEGENGNSNLSRKYVNDELFNLKRWVMERDSLFLGSVNQNYVDSMNTFRMGSVCAKFFKRKLLERVSFRPSLGMSEDLVFIYEIMGLVNEVFVTNAAWYSYTNNGISLTHVKYSRTIIKDNLSLSKVLLSFKKDFDSEFEQFMYLKVIRCYWESIVRGISSDEHITLIEKFKSLHRLNNIDEYRYAFKKMNINNCKGIKNMVICLFGKCHLSIFLLFFARYFRKE